MHVNLLPDSFRRRLLVRRCLRVWSLIWLGCLVTCAAYLGAQYRTLRRERTALAAAELRSQPVTAVAAQSRQLEQKIREAQARKANLLQMAPHNRALPVLSIVAQAAQSLEGRLQLRRLALHDEVNLPDTTGKPDSAVSPKPSMRRGQLLLEAIAADDADVASFIEALKGVKALRQVELKSSIQWNDGSRDYRKFDVICSF